MQIKKVNLTLKMPKKFDFLLQLAVLILIAFGTLMIISTNVGMTYKDPDIVVKVLLKQILYVVVSYVLMTFFANNFTLRRAQKFYVLFGIAILCALFSTQLFTGVLGSKAWIRFTIPKLGEVSIQPSEFAKVFMIVIMGLFVELYSHKPIQRVMTRKQRNRECWAIVKWPVLFFIVMAAAICLQPDLGTLLVLGLICAICFLIPSHPSLRRQQRWLRWIFIGGAIFCIFMMSEPVIEFINKIKPLQTVAVRIENAVNPFMDPHGKGYQLINGLYGIARSGFTGVGLGNSIQKYGYLTQSDNDFILAIIIEELGIFGLLVVVLGYFVILQRLFYYAFHSKSEGYKVILIGTAMYIFIHFALNVGGISGLIPLTGVPLLFISSGGSSLMSIMTAIGISQAVIAQIRRQGTVVKVKKEP